MVNGPDIHIELTYSDDYFNINKPIEYKIQKPNPKLVKYSIQTFSKMLENLDWVNMIKKLFNYFEIRNIEFQTGYDNINHDRIYSSIKNLSISNSLLIADRIGQFPNLEELTITDDLDSKEIHSGIRRLNLRKGCRFLKFCPNLEELNLDGCTDFNQNDYPNGFPTIKKLKITNIRLTTKLLRLFPNLEEIIFNNSALRDSDHPVEYKFQEISLNSNTGVLKINYTIRRVFCRFPQIQRVNYRGFVAHRL